MSTLTREWSAYVFDIGVAYKAAFDREQIEIPFPHRTIYNGEVSKPLEM